MNREIKGNIHSLESFGAVDGPGIRFVIFVQGCPLRCLYCHNPDSREFKSEKQMTVGQCMDQIISYKNFIKNGGVTVSGGEPLTQPDFCEALIDECHKEGIHVAIDTSGIVPVKVGKRVLEKADLLLLDIKALDDDMCIKLTGFSNKSAIETLNFREERGLPVWIRHVIVPQYTLNYDMLRKTAKFLKNYRCVQKVELLPFHKMGEYKWKELGEKYELYDIPQPTKEEVEKARQIFKDEGLPL